VTGRQGIMTFEATDWIMLGFLTPAIACIAWILWRYPGLRRELHPNRVAAKLAAWAERQGKKW
jgi:hypothetical protein